jgi:hypothetical protein
MEVIYGSVSIVPLVVIAVLNFSGRNIFLDYCRDGAYSTKISFYNFPNSQWNRSFKVFPQGYNL